MIEALYYKRLDDKKVLCSLCPHECILNEGQYGICNSRKNIDGKLMATSYGNLCSIGIDPVEKKPLMQFLPGTMTYSISSAGCNFRCMQCQNDAISQHKPEERTTYVMTPTQVVNDAINNGCKSISYTYTEPTTFYEFMLDTAKLASEKNLKNIMVSNGYIKDEPLRELCKYVDAFNIDLKYWSDDSYMKISKGNLQPILTTLEIIKNNNRWLEITNLIIPEINDDIKNIKNMCYWLKDNGFDKYPLHFSRFYPRYKFSDKKWTDLNTVIEARDIARKIGIKYVYLGNVPDEFSGIMKCKCGEVILERYGYDIIRNNIEFGKCKYCGEMADGIY